MRQKLKSRQNEEVNWIDSILMNFFSEFLLFWWGVFERSSSAPNSHGRDSCHDPTSSSLMKAFYRHQIKANFWRIQTSIWNEKFIWSLSKGMISTNFCRFFQISIFPLKFVKILCFRMNNSYWKCTNIFNSFISMFFFNLFHHFFVTWHCAIIVLVFLFETDITWAMFKSTECIDKFRMSENLPLN